MRFDAHNFKLEPSSLLPLQPISGRKQEKLQAQTSTSNGVWLLKHYRIRGVILSRCGEVTRDLDEKKAGQQESQDSYSDHSYDLAKWYLHVTMRNTNLCVAAF